MFQNANFGNFHIWLSMVVFHHKPLHCIGYDRIVYKRRCTDYIGTASPACLPLCSVIRIEVGPKLTNCQGVKLSNESSVGKSRL